jgi:DNA-binding HxlR family transcriptional regulator
VRKVIRNRPEPELFTLNCPTQQVLDIIGNKCETLVEPLSLLAEWSEKNIADINKVVGK